jgi:hypothetical protein
MTRFFQSVGTLIVFAMKRGVQFHERVSLLSEGVVVAHDVLSHVAFLNVYIVQRNKECCPVESRDS